MPAALELSGIDKSFDGFRALQGTQFSVARGQIGALLGENGAGKSTLMNIAAGLYQPDAGRLLVDGIERRLGGPLDAAACGIGMVHQHFKLVQALTVAENVLMSTPKPAGERRSFRARLREVAIEIGHHAGSLGFEIDPAACVGTLSVAEQQRVEILKALIGAAQILILDEPTSVLTDLEAGRLLATLRLLAGQGRAVVLVTHKLSEVLDHADRITVMRAGRTVGTLAPAATDRAALTTMVVGETAPIPPRTAHCPGAARLTVSQLATLRSNGSTALDGISFTVHAGEVYGIAGVGGNGQTELVESLLGLAPPRAGAIIVEGAGDIAAWQPERRRGLGIAAIPADRYGLALAGGLSVMENFAINRLHTGRYGSWMHVNAARMRQDAGAAVTAFAVQGVRSLTQKASLLSGGNAQKLVIAREFGDAPRIVVAHSPARGLDLRACADIHQRLLQAKANGAAVLLISDDLDEVLALADRVGVINRGRILAEYSVPVDRQLVGQAMVGHA